MQGRNNFPQKCPLGNPNTTCVLNGLYCTLVGQKKWPHVLAHAYFDSHDKATKTIKVSVRESNYRPLAQGFFDSCLC